MQLHVSVRNILKRSTQLALCSGSASVTSEHLLQCNPDQEWTEPVPDREISFAPDSLEILSLAAEQAAFDDMQIVRIGHLELALLVRTACQPVWSEYNPSKTDGFSRLLFSAARQSLPNRMLVLKGLLDELSEYQVPLVEVVLGRLEVARFKGHAHEVQGMPAFTVLLLLRFAMSPTPLGELLRRHGLTESTLVELLERLRKPLASPRSIDFTECLGDGFQRLTEKSREALCLAWLLRDGDELTGRDLLRALIATSNQTEDRNVHSLLQSLRPQAQFAERLVTSLGQDKLAPPTLSAEFYRVFSVALREAGRDARITDYDLLLGLAESGQELLAQENITPEEIRSRWAEGF